MINLLPLEEKQKLFIKNKEKLAAIWGIVVLVSLICLTLILLSVKFYILSESDYQSNVLKQAQQAGQTADFINLSSVIQKYNGILAQLNSFYKKEIYFSRALETITDVSRPKGVYLMDFSLNRDEKGKIKAKVSGISDTRGDLLVFKKSIEQDPKIINPYFSPESWMSPEDVNFSLTFEINEN